MRRSRAILALGVIAPLARFGPGGSGPGSALASP
jgi:hypothetical protein